MAGLAFDDDLAVVVFDDGFDDGEAETGVTAAGTAGGIDAVEAIEEARQMFGGDALAAINDFEDGLRGFTFGRWLGGKLDADFAAGFLMLDGV